MSDDMSTSTPAKRPSGRPITNGAQATVMLAPQVVSMKKALLARMGLRQRDLTWVGREHLDGYCRAKAKVVAIDQWLESHPLIDGEGRAPAIMVHYFTAANTATRALEALRGVVSDLSREDRDLASALEALDKEDAKKR